ncbi:MAG: hypothetical protein IIU15_08235 [Treponema sp.]|nr:hypothetical protein [Treponema sp.]
MSRRIDRRKQTFANILRTVLGLFLVVFCSTVIVQYVTTSSTVMEIQAVTKADSQNPDVLSVQKIIMDIENGDGDSAVEKIDALDKNFSDAAVLEYLGNFKNYYLRQTAKTKEAKKIESLSTLYFVLRSVDLKEFFEKNRVQNVIHYLEVIPYFCIKYFEQGKGSNQKKNNASNLELYEKYIATFIESGAVTITSTEADIICLYISAKKKSSGNSDVEVTQIQKEIEKIQSDYHAQLGENGTCVRQRDALEKMHWWCVEKINRHFLRDLFLGSFPWYTIPIEKK